MSRPTHPSAVWLIPLGLLLVGCDGIEPLRPDGGTPFDASGLVAADCVDEDVARRWVLEPSCGSSDCHDAERPSAGLDLVTPGVTSRIMFMTSVHEACAEVPIVTPGIAQGSFLMDKVLAQEGECGDPMPREGELSLEARRCLVQWIGAMPAEER
ncbi:MAG: hypothetical protein AB8I08_06205 [Sandaracinaceae bacterium]